MCGIFGHTKGKKKQDLSKSRDALSILEHRGPDQWNDWYNEDIYLGHRRLSIMDLSEAGKQPMLIKRQDGSSVVLIANGEIWNYKALRAELELKHSFSSNSDSEVILHGYIEWGLDSLLEKLDGMYAFCLYDSSKHRLFLIRDRFGVKPIYFSPPSAYNEYQFSFASEAKAILYLYPGLRAFSIAGIADWILHRGSYTGLTPYSGIFRIMPGHYLSVDTKNGEYVTKQYYELLDKINTTPTSENKLDSLFRNAVNKRLMSDVPLGLQLSGGIDSSLVAAEFVSINPTQNSSLHSFSIGFSEREDKSLSEEPYARFVAQNLGLTHHQFDIDKEKVSRNFSKVVWLSDGMLDFPNSIAIYQLCLYAKSYVSVQLTGEGADELMGGYTKFKKAISLANETKNKFLVPDFILSLLSKIHPKIARNLYLRNRYAGKKNEILNHLNSYVSRKTVEHVCGYTPSLLLDQVYPPESKNRVFFDSLSFEKQLLLLDHKTYLMSVLERQDKASMGASIEARVPFLDKDLVEWAINLPVNKLILQTETKIILKNRAAKIFSNAFAYRSKRGFSIPIYRWMKLNDGFGEFLKNIDDDEFLLREMVTKYRQTKTKAKFDNILLNYADTESQWMLWFFMVLREAQRQFLIVDVREV